jgi:hypothetical protein
MRQWELPYSIVTEMFQELNIDVTSVETWRYPSRIGFGLVLPCLLLRAFPSLHHTNCLSVEGLNTPIMQSSFLSCYLQRFHYFNTHSLLSPVHLLTIKFFPVFRQTTRLGPRTPTVILLSEVAILAQGTLDAPHLPHQLLRIPGR